MFYTLLEIRGGFFSVCVDDFKHETMEDGLAQEPEIIRGRRLFPTKEGAGVKN